MVAQGPSKPLVGIRLPPLAPNLGSMENVLTFTITEDEVARVKDQIDEHLKTCKPRPDVTGAWFSYMFLPTGIGVISKVVCPCGAQFDMTDYDLF